MIVRPTTLLDIKAILDAPSAITAQEIERAGFTSWQALKFFRDCLVEGEARTVFDKNGPVFILGITTAGDTASGEGLTGDNLLMYASAFRAAMAYIRTQEQAGNLTVCRGVSGFYYGSN